MADRRRFGRYLILKPLERGGMGSVQLARREDRPGLFVLKQLLVEHEGNSAMVRRFRREAQLTPFLDHPRIARVVDAGTEQGTFYIAFEHIAGETLARLLRRMLAADRWLSPELAIHVVLEVLDGLAYAHECADPSGKPLGLVHRDLSPSNVMIAFSGQVKIIDFGIAFGGVEELQTLPGSFVGTVRYMSPEQALGRSVDRKSDLYTVGVVLWELLARRRLVPKRTLGEMVAEVVERRAPPLLEAAPELPAELSRVVARALRKEPEQRYPSAGEMRAALAAAAGALAGREIEQVQAERAASQGLAEAGGRVHPGRDSQVRVLSSLVRELCPDELREAEFLHAEAGAALEAARTLHADGPPRAREPSDVEAPESALERSSPTLMLDAFDAETPLKPVRRLSSWEDKRATVVAHRSELEAAPGGPRVLGVEGPTGPGMDSTEESSSPNLDLHLGFARVAVPPGRAATDPEAKEPFSAPLGGEPTAPDLAATEQEPSGLRVSPATLDDTITHAPVLRPGPDRAAPGGEASGPPRELGAVRVIERVREAGPAPSPRPSPRPGPARWSWAVPALLLGTAVLLAAILYQRTSGAPALPAVTPPRATRSLGHLERLEEARARLFRDGAGPAEVGEACALGRDALGRLGVSARATLEPEVEAACTSADRARIGASLARLLEALEERR